MNYLTGDAAVRRMAELKEKWEMDRISEIDYAQTKGKEEGKKHEQIETAKRMLKENMPIDVIEKITQLTNEEIQSLK